MQSQFVSSAGLQSVDAAISPHVRSVPAMLTKFEAVDVRRRAVLEGKDEFMAGAIERAHAPIVLRPDDQVLQFRIVGASRLQHLAHVAPVHANKMDRTIDGMSSEMGEGGREEIRELFARHFTRRHCEVAVASVAEPAHIAVNRDVIGRR